MEEWETRRGARAPITVEVQVQVNPAMKETVQLSKEGLQATLVDISTTGVGMTCTTFLPKGVLVDFSLPRTALEVPGKVPPPGIPPLQGEIKITGLIVYAKPKEAVCQMGISITQIEEKDKRLIQAFVESSERRQAPRARLE